MGLLRSLRMVGVTLGAVGGLSGAAYGLLTEQGRRARAVIGKPARGPLVADGVYPGPGADPLTFAVLGDSVAAGLGAETTDTLLGVLLARSLAERAARPVRLTTYAVSGTTTRTLAAQVDRALADPPQLALVIVGGNDVTSKMRVRTSAALLTVEVGRLRAAGTTVVVGTCPDLGTVRPIPQPLRTVVRVWSRLLAGAQRRAVERAGGHPVPVARLLAPEFLARPELFSPDRFHPNGAGYTTAAEVLLVPLCVAAGLWLRPVHTAQ